MASSNFLEWSEWRLQGSGWSCTYDAEATVSVSRAIGSDTASVSIDVSMWSPSGDSNSQGWDCIVEVGGTEQTFSVSALSGHIQNRKYTATATYTVSVGPNSGTLTGNVRFRIKGFPGLSGEYSPYQQYSVDYDSKGESTIASVSKSSVYFAETFTVTVNRNSSNYRESVIIKYGNNFENRKTLSEYSDSSASSTTRTVSIPASLCQGLGTGFNFKVALKTYDGSTQIGDEYVDDTVRTVSFSQAQLTTATNWQNAYFGNNSTITLTRRISYFRETVKLIWSNGTEVTLRAYTDASSGSTTINYLIPYSALESDNTDLHRGAVLSVLSYNGDVLVNTANTGNNLVTIKPGDDHYKPTINNDVAVSFINSIPEFGYNAIVDTSKIYAEMTSSSVVYKEGATKVAWWVAFSIATEGSPTDTGTAIHANSVVIPTAQTYVDFTVTDSRGLTTVLRKPVYAEVVAPPTFSTLNVYRANGSGEPDDTGRYICALAVPSYVPTISGVTNTVSIKMSVNGGSQITIQPNTVTRIYENADTSIAYTVSAVVSDLIHTTSAVRTVSAEACSFNIKNNGDGLGIGRYSTHSGAIDLAYDIYTDGNIVNKNYQNVVSAGTNATIDNAGKGISTYFVAYCGLDANDEVVSGTEGAGMLVMFEGQEIMKEGFTGLTTSISGTIFSFGWTSGNNKLKYRVFENNLGSYT